MSTDDYVALLHRQDAEEENKEKEKLVNDLVFIATEIFSRLKIEFPRVSEIRLDNKVLSENNSTQPDTILEECAIQAYSVLAHYYYDIGELCVAFNDKSMSCIICPNNYREIVINCLPLFNRKVLDPIDLQNRIPDKFDIDIKFNKNVDPDIDGDIKNKQLLFTTKLKKDDKFYDKYSLNNDETKYITNGIKQAIIDFFSKVLDIQNSYTLKRLELMVLEHKMYHILDYFKIEDKKNEDIRKNIKSHNTIELLFSKRIIQLKEQCKEYTNQQEIVDCNKFIKEYRLC